MSNRLIKLSYPIATLGLSGLSGLTVGGGRSPVSSSFKACSTSGGILLNFSGISGVILTTEFLFKEGNIKLWSVGY